MSGFSATGPGPIRQPCRDSPGSLLVIIFLFFLISAIPAAAAAAGVEPGSVTIAAVYPGDTQADPHFQFRMGDTITFTGTNAVSGTTYLFLVGPNLKANGSQIQSDYPPGEQVVEGDAATFATAAVGPDGRWSYAWDTNRTTLGPGAYTIFAVSRPHDKAHLANTPYDATPVILGKQQAPAKTRQEKYVLEETFVVNPAGPVTEGTPVTVTSSVNFVIAGAETFPWGSDLLFSTTLDNPHWTWSLVIDGVENKKPAQSGKVLDLSGFELSFPSTVNEERVVVTLEGTAPAVQEGRTKTAIQVSVMDTTGNTLPNTTVRREITILPRPEVTRYETPTTASGMPKAP